MKRRIGRGNGPRKLYLVDIENEIGTDGPSDLDVQLAIRVLWASVPPGPTDQAAVACSHHAGATVAFAWSWGLLRFKSGKDGADLALLAELVATPWDRFDELVIVSGDGIFTDHVAAREADGTRVTVVSQERCLSRRLRMAASRVVILPPREEWGFLDDPSDAA